MKEKTIQTIIQVFSLSASEMEIVPKIPRTVTDFFLYVGPVPQDAVRNFRLRSFEPIHESDEGRDIRSGWQFTMGGDLTTEYRIERESIGDGVIKVKPERLFPSKYCLSIDYARSVTMGSIVSGARRFFAFEVAEPARMSDGD